MAIDGRSHGDGAVTVRERKKSSPLVFIGSTRIESPNSIICSFVGS